VSEASTASDADGSRRRAPGVRPTEGGIVGTAREELTDLIGESLLGTRKNFGMFGQIQISMRDVTPQWLSVGICFSSSLRSNLDRRSPAIASVFRNVPRG
jgi:hypothetical protein